MIADIGREESLDPVIPTLCALEGVDQPSTPREAHGSSSQSDVNPITNAFGDLLDDLGFESDPEVAEVAVRVILLAGRETAQVERDGVLAQFLDAFTLVGKDSKGGLVFGVKSTVDQNLIGQKKQVRDD
ncbi:hypothetical protein [Natrialba swarupiae]|uniref:Uncharacterized protein n=1 Tax=Natrialba swarupiae TaxID=2448032 RepID=A0A5D5AHB7_9EURY|nr:hypothetical protein [Natrialba swarupiae]TYT60524.1 hypothetical protein FYC77_18305 [Natrialba swarupiae]